VEKVPKIAKKLPVKALTFAPPLYIHFGKPEWNNLEFLFFKKLNKTK